MTLTPPRLPSTARFVVALGLAGGLVLAACGKGGYNGSLAAATTATAPTVKGSTATTQAVAAPAATRAAILAAYHGYWDALVAAGKTANPNYPGLARYATGAALVQAQTHFDQLRHAGQVDLGTVTLHPTITSVGPRVAAISDCTDTTHWLRRDAKTGALRENPATAPDKDLVSLTLTGGTWKVSYLTRMGTCAS